MGVFIRPDSCYWWYYNERTKERIPTDILVGVSTAQRKDSKRLAEVLYHQAMLEQSKRVHRLQQERPAIRFAAYAATYQTDVIAHRAGQQREGELLTLLVAFFGDDLLTQITKERVQQYHTHRKSPRTAAVTINREVDLLKGMLRDAVPTYLEASPIVGMKRLRIVPPRRRYTSAEEFDKLLAVCEDAQDTAILVFGRDGLARLGDLLDLKHTDRDGPIYWIGDPKNGEPYEMALSPRAVAAADALANNESKYLFPKFRRAENPRDWAGSVRQRLEYLCRQVDPPLPYGRAKHGVTFHWGTRRSGATDYIRAGHNLKAVQGQGGWKKPNVLLEIYAEVSRDDKLALVGQTAKKAARRKRA